jgi:hypothetical protein
MTKIGSLNEQPLHSALKSWYAGTDGQMEVGVDGYIVDVVHGQQLIEIQTGNFYSIKKKLKLLAINHPIKLVYPITTEKWLLKLPIQREKQPQRRKSPKRGKPIQIFAELVSFPEILLLNNFSLELALIKEEEVRQFTGKKLWYQNGWHTIEHRLLDVNQTLCFENAEEISKLLPGNLPAEFTTADIGITSEIPRWLAQKMAYCLRKMGVIQVIGKRKHANLYRKVL